MPLDDYDTSSLDSSQEPRPASLRSPSRRSWKPWLLYPLAALGLMALAVSGIALWAHSRSHRPVRIDGDEVIDTVMQRTYGKYSEADKGWLWVGPGKVSYLVQVVQRAKITHGPDENGDDELYFVTAGGALVNPADHPSITGVFQVKGDPDKHDGTLLEISAPFRQEENARPLRPEGVKFEALGAHQWGWVLKPLYDGSAHEEPTAVWNVVMAPHGNEIAELARFPASLHYQAGSDCATAERNDQASAAERRAYAASAAASGAMSESDDDEPPAYEGLRCSDARWTYRTDSVPNDGMVAITVTGGGLVNGEQRPTKSWKLVFDPKSFSYPVPEELSF